MKNFVQSYFVLILQQKLIMQDIYEKIPKKISCEAYFFLTPKVLQFNNLYFTNARRSGKLHVTNNINKHSTDLIIAYISKTPIPHKQRCD